MKVLASYPEEHATVASLKTHLAILSGAGLCWTTRLKRLAARFPNLDIFGQSLVVRDGAGWHLTAAGRELLSQMETPEVMGEPVNSDDCVASYASSTPRVFAKNPARTCFQCRGEILAFRVATVEEKKALAMGGN